MKAEDLIGGDYHHNGNLYKIISLKDNVFTLKRYDAICLKEIKHVFTDNAEEIKLTKEDVFLSIQNKPKIGKISGASTK